MFFTDFRRSGVQKVFLMKMAEKWRWVLFLNFICIIGSGCGGGQANDQPGLGIVKGKVTMDGSPLPNASVVFSPEKGRSSTDITDSEGNYELIYVGDTKGAKLGSHKVSITTAKEESTQESEKLDSKSMKETIPTKYNARSTLTELVKEGKNEIDFELTSYIQIPL